MQVLSLWNPDHLPVGVTMSTNPITSAISSYNGPTSNNNLLSYGQQGTANYNGRTWLMLGGVSPLYTACVNLVPTLAQLKAGFPNVSKHYAGIRVYTGNILSGGGLLYMTTPGSAWSYAPTVGNEYVIEVITDLVNDTRVIWINGGAYNNPNQAVDSQIVIGNNNATTSKLMNSTANWIGVTDIYSAVAYIGDANIPARLGKMTVKSTPVVNTENDSKFSKINAVGTFADILNKRRGVYTAATEAAILTDSNSSKMKINFATPTAGDTVVGACLRVSAYINPTDQAVVRAMVSGEEKILGVAQSSATAQNGAYVALPNPAEGWSEAALGAANIQIFSKRNV